jgi:hypothetical protein
VHPGNRERLSSLKNGVVPVLEPSSYKAILLPSSRGVQTCNDRLGRRAGLSRIRHPQTRSNAPLTRGSGIPGPRLEHPRPMVTNHPPPRWRVAEAIE